ncbi:hypothetical protein WAI453_010792 [Rhynchosporium graminicola]
MRESFLPPSLEGDSRAETPRYQTLRCRKEPGNLVADLIRSVEDRLAKQPEQKNKEPMRHDFESTVASRDRREHKPFCGSVLRQFSDATPVFRSKDEALWMQDITSRENRQADSLTGRKLPRQFVKSLPQDVYL